MGALLKMIVRMHSVDRVGEHGSPGSCWKSMCACLAREYCFPHDPHYWAASSTLLMVSHPNAIISYCCCNDLLTGVPSPLLALQSVLRIRLVCESAHITSLLKHLLEDTIRQ